MKLFITIPAIILLFFPPIGTIIGIVILIISGLFSLGLEKIDK